MLLLSKTSGDMMLTNLWDFCAKHENEFRDFRNFSKCPDAVSLITNSSHV